MPMQVAPVFRRPWFVQPPSLIALTIPFEQENDDLQFMKMVSFNCVLLFGLAALAMQPANAQLRVSADCTWCHNTLTVLSLLIVTYVD